MTNTVVFGFDEAMKTFDPKIVIAATNATLNKTITTVRTQASKQITGVYAVKARDVKKGMSVKKSRFTTLVAELGSTGVRLPLALFSPVQKRDGVTVKIKRKNPRQVLKRMFVATMRNGHVGVFSNHRYTRRKVNRRKQYPRRGDRPTHSELPVDEAFTLATAQMWDLKESEAVVAKRAPIVFEQEMNYRLSKARSKN